MIRFRQWPSGVAEAELKIDLVYQMKSPGQVPGGDSSGSLEGPDPESFYVSESVQLQVGGLDPLTGSEQDRSRAIQKILTNLSLYGGPIDGDLTTSRSRAAIQKFQANHGIETSNDLLNMKTVNAILNEQGSQIGNSRVPFQAQTKDRDLPLSLGAEADQTERGFDSFSLRYEDPKEFWQERPIGKLRFFPETAYVAVSDTDTNQNPNVIRIKSRKIIFVDSGRWCKAGRDFTVIFGRHVYLCEFVRDAGPGAAADPPPGDKQRLDRRFFEAMGANVKVNFRASAHWALEDEFDWSRLVVVIPDLHLMNLQNGLIFRGPTFSFLDPELDLLIFAKKLLAAKIPGLQVVQLGDSNDLWVGCEPHLFKKTDDLLVELYHPHEQRWSCGSVTCTGPHLSPDGPPCASGVWKCRNFYCLGDHPSKAAACLYIDTWNCGCSDPPCPGHFDASGVCDTSRGFLWKCNKTEPPCPGHEGPQAGCPETIDAVSQIVTWIGDIRGASGWVAQAIGPGSVPAGIDPDADLAQEDGSYLNPACAALDLLEGNLNVTYLHGNHDNYLILNSREVINGARISKRHRYFETDGVLIEHGHRLERRLVVVGDTTAPTNYDGSITGYDATLKQYHDQYRLILAAGPDTHWYDWKSLTRTWLQGKEDFADWAAQKFQQPQYMTEFAQLWLGRASLKNHPAPHIFGIGHTHDPLLQYVNIFPA